MPPPAFGCTGCGPAKRARFACASVLAIVAITINEASSNASAWGCARRRDEERCMAIMTATILGPPARGICVTFLAALAFVCCAHDRALHARLSAPPLQFHVEHGAIARIVAVPWPRVTDVVEAQRRAHEAAEGARAVLGVHRDRRATRDRLTGVQLLRRARGADVDLWTQRRKATAVGEHALLRLDRGDEQRHLRGHAHIDDRPA